MFFLHSAFRFGTAAIVIVAVELTIHWNAIQGVDTASSAGQLIPTALGAGSLARILYVRYMDGPSAAIRVANRKAIMEAGAPQASSHVSH